MGKGEKGESKERLKLEVDAEEIDGVGWEGDGRLTRTTSYLAPPQLAWSRDYIQYP